MRIPDEEHLEKLEQRRQELEAELAERRARINNNLRRVRARLSARERKHRTQRLIVLGRFLEHQTEGNPKDQARLLKDLDAFVTRDDHRSLFDLPPLDEPSTPTTSPSAPTGSRDDPIPGWHPYRITGTNQWGAAFEGDTSTLPAELVGLYILITARSKRGKSWAAPVSEVLERTDRLVHVRTKRVPNG